MKAGRLRGLVGPAGLVGLAAWPLLQSSPYDLRLFTLAGVFALMVLGYQFIFGHAGALALAQGAFFGLGAYATGLLAVRLGWNFLATFPASIAVSVAMAALVALPTLRLSSHYLALATLGVGQILFLLAVEWESLTGGANGFSGVPLPAMGGWSVARGWPLLLLVWGVLGIGALLTWQVMRGLYGTACHVMRDNELAARSLGIDTDRQRFAMLLLSAGFGGAAGALYAHTIRVVSPEALDFKVMLTCLTMTVVGGRTQIWGAVLGALLLVHVPEWFRTYASSYLIVTSAVVIMLLVVAPDGLAGFIARLLPPRPARLDVSAPPARPATARAMLTPSPTPLLEIEDLTKSFGGVQALSGVGLRLGRASITAVIGPNGSGKTTMVNCITGVYRPEDGQITLGGQAITGLAPQDIARRGIGRTFQNLRLIDGLSVLDNVAVARFLGEGVGLRRALLAGWRDARQVRAQEHAMHLLRQFDLQDLARRRCGSLAYGLKRRVEIARALALDPLLLVLDEPAAGLNETEQADLAERLQDIAADGLTLMIVEHNMPFLRSLATAMVCLDEGRVIAEGRPRDVMRDPQVLDAYLGARAAAMA